MESTDFLNKDSNDDDQCKAAVNADESREPSNDKVVVHGSRRGFLKMWNDFGDSTSMHGLGRAINSARIWKKIMWSLLVLGAAGIASRNLYMTFEDYFSYPVSTMVTLETKLSMDFPAVTICNLNPYKFRNLKEEVKQAVVQSVMDGHSVKKQKETFRMLFNKHYNVYDLPRNIRHSLSNMLIDCQFDMEPCSSDEFLLVPNIKNGDCYTFNFDENKARKTTRAGSKNGLILELDVEQDDYLPLTPSAGLKVLIHPPESVPFPYEDGIVVRPGVSTNVGLRKVAIQRQIPPWGACIEGKDTEYADMNMFRSRYFNGHKYGYSQMACEKTCYQLELKYRCDCCDIVYPCVGDTNGYTQECNITQKEISNCLNEVRNLYLGGDLECMLRCKPPCIESMYKSSYSVSAWPSVKYVDNFNTKAIRARKSRNQTGEYTPDELRRNFVRLEVHYEKLTEESIVATPAYNWNKLLSDLGGQLGLWMGFSLMTAIEFLELGVDFVGRLCCKLSC